MTTVLIVIAVAIVALLLFTATRPDGFEIRRSATFTAPPERIFPLLNDFHRWTEWSPWEKLDPALVRTYSGAESGPGAIYDWSGNKKAGRGRMEITSATPPSKLTIKLDFFEPFEAHNTTVFTLVPAGATTRMDWVMTGTRPFMMKLMGLFMNFDNLVGKDFETGLANLKAAVER